MTIVFYTAGAVAIIATILMLTRLDAVHALLHLIVSLLAVAVIFFVLGAPFVAALEVIIYAGAIMVLFVFVVMLLNLGEAGARAERVLLTPSIWIGPSALAAILLAEFVWLLASGNVPPSEAASIGPVEVGMALFGQYLIGVELASMLLLGGLVAAYHLGWRKAPQQLAQDPLCERVSQAEATHVSHP
ncbi:MAG: NADH-quinone oxidoreductase subunit J [Bryobacterales bacterium]|nr:NADH-quinone oxidoreductase subunit J [Bryobacterales bacterium]